MRFVLCRSRIASSGLDAASGSYDDFECPVEFGDAAAPAPSNARYRRPPSPPAAAAGSANTSKTHYATGACARQSWPAHRRTPTRRHLCKIDSNGCNLHGGDSSVGESISSFKPMPGSVVASLNLAGVLAILAPIRRVRRGLTLALGRLLRDAQRDTFRA